MPKVLSHTPSWLSRPSPGFNFFQPNKHAEPEGHQPSRLVAFRHVNYAGPEIFAVVGNELRWTDLSWLKETGEEWALKHGRVGASWRDVSMDSSDGEKQPTRVRMQPKTQVWWKAMLTSQTVLQTPVAFPIQQISISPDGAYIAILTSHTAHICILPSSSFLRSQLNTPIRLKSFQVGPTAHVLEQPPLVSVLWHPLSPDGNALVTVTKDACVRLWELDPTSRSSFSEAALAVDLKKLANANNSQADFSASKYGTSLGFSPDEVEMEVASACFGGHGAGDEHGWASMTLWIAMTEGDIYALCPFLPSKFRAPALMLSGLTTAVVAKERAISAGIRASESERRISDQQTKWLADIDAQEPLVLRESEWPVEVYERPQRPGVIAKLQGPFTMSPEPDFGEITDIHVIPPKLDPDSLFDDSEDIAEDFEKGLSVAIICVANSSGKVNVCLDVEGIGAEWLPSRRARGSIFDEAEEKELLVLETIEVDKTASPMKFTPSATNLYEIFVTSKSGVHGISFQAWIDGLEAELSSTTDQGIAMRLDTLFDSQKTIVDHPVKLVDSKSPTTVISYFDQAWGHVLFSLSFDNVPRMAVLDLRAQRHPFAPEDENRVPFPLPEPRAPYQPSQAFDPQATASKMQAALEKYTQQAKNSLSKPFTRSSPADLKILTDAHRVFSQQTHEVALAAAELFRACERMISELEQQVKNVREIAFRVDTITGDDEIDMDYEELDTKDEGAVEEDFRTSTRDEFRNSAKGSQGPTLVGKEAIDARIEGSKLRTESLNMRVEELRKKMRRLYSAPLSAKEEAFAEEVQRAEMSTAGFETKEPEESQSEVDAPSSPASLLKLPNSSSSPAQKQRERPGDAAGAQAPGELTRRLQEVQDLHQQLTAEATELQTKLAEKDKNGTPSKETTASGYGISAGLRKKRMDEIWEMLDRETALVDAVGERLKVLVQNVG